MSSPAVDPLSDDDGTMITEESDDGFDDMDDSMGEGGGKFFTSVVDSRLSFCFGLACIPHLPSLPDGEVPSIFSDTTRECDD